MKFARRHVLFGLLAVYVSLRLIGAAGMHTEGFLLDADQASRLASSDPNNSARIFDYVGGEDLNTSPVQSSGKFAINFGQLSLLEAGAWPELLGVVRERVKPQRDALGDNSDARQYKEKWWQFGRPSPALAAACRVVPRVLAAARVTKHLSFSFQDPSKVFNEKVCVFMLDRMGQFAALQSRIHESWARLLSSKFGSSSTSGPVLNYSASECFETFPFPQPNPRTVIPSLETLGETLYTQRAKYMLDEIVGLTVTYNRLKDPDVTEARIVALRALHEELDCAVLTAYGWTDLVPTVPPFCIANDADKEALETFERAVIDRLFALNAARAEEERIKGLGAPTKGKPAATKALASEKKPARAKKTPVTVGQLTIPSEGVPPEE